MMLTRFCSGGKHPRAGWAALLFPLAVGAACDDGDHLDTVVAGNSADARGGAPDADATREADWAPPRLRNPVALSDDQLAQRALTLLGSTAVGASGSCGDCHALGRPTLTRWSQLTTNFVQACLDPAPSVLPDGAAADDMLACFRAHAAPARAFAASQFGIYAAAAHLPWFTFLFEHASSASSDGSEHDDFVARVGMPRAGTPWTQREFDEVAEWFARGVPGLFELVPEDAGEDCEPWQDPALSVHVEEMARRGWRAQNEQVPLLMFGCDAARASVECLNDFPLASDALGEDGAAPAAGRVRVLYDNSAQRSAYWSRTSADGRYMASGRLERGPDGHLGQFVDLARGAAIGAAFSYDPSFFPDNSGFLLQRGGGNGSEAPGGATRGFAEPGDVALVCEQSVLAESPSELTGDEDACIQLDSQIGLYQQTAKSLDGDDYWVVFGSYDSDDGGLGQPVTSNPAAAFEARSTITLVPMLNRGSGFEPGAPARVPTPSQGDPMLSPSGRLLVTRVKGAEITTRVDGRSVVSAEQSGYALHRVDMQRQGAGYDVQLSDVGSICLQGGKAVFSYDERWLVLHHYVTQADAGALGFSGPDDPGFEPYSELGASNLILVDLLDGTSRQITRMDAGHYALFPHFRSDGWIYFVVRTLDGRELFAASDAALVLEGGGR